MIWLFRIDEVFNGDKSKVNRHYTFDTDDINFDIDKYDITLYFATGNYCLLNESNDKKIYNLFYTGNRNPHRGLVEEGSVYYNIVRSYYIETIRDIKIDSIIK